MKKAKKIKVLLTVLIMLFSTLTVGCATKNQKESIKNTKTFKPFIRMDRDDANAWKRELENVRFITQGLYKLEDAKDKYGINDINPSEEGLDNLNISGSAQFSLPQFYKLSDELKKIANGKKVYIIDLRRESHVLLGAIPVSWYESHDWGNVGLTIKEIEKDEIKRFAPLIGKTIKAYAREDDKKIDETKINVNGFITEKEIVESVDFNYYRLPIQDHTWPSKEEIDSFVDFIKNIDMENSWLHFHCQAGSGRTGIFMSIYDKMKNPDVEIEDIAIRQTKLGASYPLYTENSDSYKVPLYEEKAKMLPVFGQYVEENYKSNYSISWSKWLKAKNIK